MSDLDKLTSALSILPLTPTALFEAFGLSNLPTAQKYGIFLGILTFTLTVGTVLTLLTLGGSWKRIEIQEKSGEITTAPDSVVQRKKRALIMERLLENRDWMMKRYATYHHGDDPFTPLTELLMTFAPKNEKESNSIYKQNYTKAYRRCQDKPGGEILGGLPEARFESYARAYAGCGERTSLHYRWSYARMYETLCGKSHETEDRYGKLWKERGSDIIGAKVRLEVLEKRHGKEFYDITNGMAYGADKKYDPEEVWGFLEYGPFTSDKALVESGIFQLNRDEAGFAIVDMITDRLVGVVHLINDDPKNLNVQLNLPIVKPSSDGTTEVMEACFLLLDRLFAYGYRRVQIAIDTQDVRAKRLPRSLGFTQEGQIPKHRIIKDSNGDSIIYGMLNSDWDGGARGMLYKKLYGEAMFKADKVNRGKEEKAEEEERKLSEQKVADGKKKT